MSLSVVTKFADKVKLRHRRIMAETMPSYIEGFYVGAHLSSPTGIEIKFGKFEHEKGRCHVSKEFVD